MAFFQEAAQILVDVRGWMFLILGGLAALYIVGDVFEYLRGKGAEKADAWKNIEDKLKMIGIVFFLVWFVTYLVGRFSRVNAAAYDYIQNAELAVNYIKAFIS